MFGDEFADEAVGPIAAAQMEIHLPAVQVAMPVVFSVAGFVCAFAMLQRTVLAIAMSMTVSPAFADDPVPRGKVAFFGIHLMNNVGDADESDERARIAMVEEQVAEDLSKPGFTLVEISPVSEQLKSIKNIASCNGCDMKLAQELGADYSATGELQKTSELILSMSFYLRDVGTKTNLRHGAVDIRGNTDESWTRGYRYLLKNIIFRGES
ncbi:DUF3280 domain-containing protein [Paracoccus sp. AK26]|uniref:DUF3280 domain-containing protein n=1 Tax=Paracoccus sp. AK26 TaxID=2589076 RepID=UPI0014311B49|nr:DUF3280 domain-containing protein [Paracoccus sp. AK26]